MGWSKADLIFGFRKWDKDTEAEAVAHKLLKASNPDGPHIHCGVCGGYICAKKNIWERHVEKNQACLAQQLKPVTTWYTGALLEASGFALPGHCATAQ